MPAERGRRGLGDPGTRRPLALVDRLWLGAAPLLIGSAHLAFGSSSRSLSALLVLCIGLLLMAQLLRASPPPAGGPVFSGVSFALVVLIALWSLTPFTIGEPQPIWDIIGASPATTIDKSATVREIAKLVGLAGIFLIGTLQGQRRRDLNATVDAILVTGAILFGVAMLMFAARLEAPGFGGRMIGPFPSPNATGSVAAALLVIAVARVAGVLDEAGVRSGRDVLHALERGAPYVAASLLFGTALALTASRGAMAAAGLAVSFWLGWRLVTAKSLWRIASGLAILSLGIGLLVLVLTEQSLVLDRAETAGQDWGDRLSIFQVYWRAFLDSPLFGYGLGTFDAVNRQLLDRSNIDALWNLGAAHNVVLQWLIETGIVGAAPMVACVAAIFASGLVRSVTSGRFPAAFGGVCMAAVVLVVHGMVDIGLQVYSIATFLAFLLGLQWSASRGRPTRS